MKIEIKLELDKDSQELIQTTLNKVADFMSIFEKFSVKAEDSGMRIQTTPEPSEAVESITEKPVQKSVENNIQTEADANKPQKSESKRKESTVKASATISEPKRRASKATSIKPKNSRASKSTANHTKKKTASDTILNVIKKSGGINVEDLKKETGFGARKIADAVYRLKKIGKIEKTDQNLYVAIG